MQGSRTSVVQILSIIAARGGGETSTSYAHVSSLTKARFTWFQAHVCGILDRSYTELPTERVSRGIASSAAEELKQNRARSTPAAGPPYARAASSAAAPNIGREPYVGTAANCWSCGSSQGSRFSFFCPECNVIQPKRLDADHYAVMGLPARTFDMDAADLEARYRSLQRLLHPDKFTTRSAEEQGYSADQASAVNVAYHTLREPLRRGNYLLHDSGIGCGEDFEGTIADPELLMEVMERREEIEGTADRAALQALRAALVVERAGVVAALSEAFSSGGLEAAGRLLVRLRYLQRMDEQILDKL